jgi:hypothetical protein
MPPFFPMPAPREKITCDLRCGVNHLVSEASIGRLWPCWSKTFIHPHNLNSKQHDPQHLKPVQACKNPLVLSAHSLNRTVAFCMLRFGWT